MRDENDNRQRRNDLIAKVRALRAKAGDAAASEAEAEAAGRRVAKLIAEQRQSLLQANDGPANG